MKRKKAPSRNQTHGLLIKINVFECSPSIAYRRIFILSDDLEASSQKETAANFDFD